MADEWKLLSFINKLLESFYIVTQKYSKNNALLSSVIPHAAVLKKITNHRANNLPSLEQISYTTLTENIEEAFKIRYYTTKNNTRVNLHDMILLFIAVDPQYQLDFFPANIK